MVPPAEEYNDDELFIALNTGSDAPRGWVKAAISYPSPAWDLVVAHKEVGNVRDMQKRKQEKTAKGRGKWP